jgi:hypothetical protein
MSRLKFIIILVAAMMAACEPPPFISRIESKSPDGKWIAGAVTMHDNRSGQFGFRTTVYLKSVTDPRAEASILVFPNEISKEKGKIDISLLWLDSGLEVMLSRIPIFDTQVTRYAGIDISVNANLNMQAPPSPAQIEAALNGVDLEAARKLMLYLHCTPHMSEHVAAVRQAWRELGGPTSTEVTQDHLIQALMAQCLIEAQPQNAIRDPDIDSAVVLLKVAIQSQDVLEALSGAIGLIRFSDPRDMQSIIDVTHRQPNTTTSIREALSYSCAPNAARTLRLMRDQAPDPATKEKIDANIQRAQPQRHASCDVNR